MKVIAVSGFKRSGKDTVANYLVENYAFKRISFADPLKKMASNLFNLHRNFFDNPETKESPIATLPAPSSDGFTSLISDFMVREFRTIDGFPPDTGYIRIQDNILQTFLNDWKNLYHTPRSLLILVGSSLRAANPYFWINKTVEEIDKTCEFRHGRKRFVVSDLRYKTELEGLKKAFGKDLFTIRVNRFSQSQSNDPSELDLLESKFDFEVENKGTKEELFDKIKEILEQLKSN